MPIKNRQQMLMNVAGTALAFLFGDRLVFSPLVAAWKSRFRGNCRTAKAGQHRTTVVVA